MVHPLKNILNRLRWDPRENADNYLITYRHRGAPNDIKQISATRIVKLGKSYFTLNEEAEDETTIPFHRILEIRNLRNGALIWTKRTLR
jgi:uncharacterized protein